MAVFSLPVRNLISLSFSAASITRKELKLWWSGNISEDLCPYFHCSTAILWTSVQYFDTMIQFEDLNFLQQRDILLIETHFLVFWHFFHSACAEIAVFLRAVRNVILFSFSLVSIYCRPKGLNRERLGDILADVAVLCTVQEQKRLIIFTFIHQNADSNNRNA